MSVAHGGQDLLRRGVVAGVRGNVRPHDPAVRRDHHRAAELSWVTEGPALKLAATEARDRALGDDLRSDQIDQTAHPGPDRFVARAMLVGEHGELDVLPSPEVGGVPGRQLTDQDQVRACGLELLSGAVQLDRVRLAVNSAVVPEPDQRSRLVAPEILKPELSAVVIRQHDVGEAGSVHVAGGYRARRSR